MRYGGDGNGYYGGLSAYSGYTFASPIFTGQIKAADGTEAAPSYSFSSATGTGLSVFSGTRWMLTNAGTINIGGENGGSVIVNKLLTFSTNPFNTSPDAGIEGVGANVLRFGGGTAVTTTSRTEINKAVTAFTDATPKTVFTVTVPNAAHHAVIELEVQGALGAGGAIGAGEAMATNTYKIAIVRTAGVATVATATAAADAVAVAVAGANTVTATAAVSGMTGAVSATQTFTIDVTITKNAGSSDNHTCLAYAKLVNAAASGITIA